MPQSPRGDGPPHLRLNSGSHEPTTDDLPTPSMRPSTSRTNTARSLTQPTRPGTAPSPTFHAPGAPHVYSNSSVAESAEMLLPPGKLRTRSYRDESPMQSPSGMSSRRTSWSSDMTGGPFGSPFDDSRAPSRAGSEDDLNTQTVSEKFNILPSSGLLLFPEDVEKDDYLHNPDPNDKDKRDCDIFTRRGMVNLGGLALLALGLLMLFIGYPILYVSAPSSLSCCANLSQYLCRGCHQARKRAMHKQPSLYSRQAERAITYQHPEGPHRSRYSQGCLRAHFLQWREASFGLL